jgi:hypothetical protein
MPTDELQLDLTRLKVSHRHSEYWTTVKRIAVDSDGEPQLKETTCCCALAGGTRKECSAKAGNKTPCRCACHAVKLR